jgi:phosphomevalonate kinase
MSLVAVAPGKAILCGEYAVLHGAPAIAVAVDRNARAQLAKVGNATPFVVEAVRHAERAAGVSAGQPVVVDTAQLFEGAHKLGLGSSAAVTAATVGLVFAQKDPSLADKRALFECADAAHAVAQGTRGSGVDVACSVYGGAIKFTRKNGIDISPVELPDGVRLTFMWAGKPASTAELIGRVKALAEAAPARHDSVIARLTAQAHAFADAVAANDVSSLLAAADGYGQAMAQLGDAAGCEIVTRPHALLAALARRHGGAAKPSGAGGGDLGVAFTVGAEATQALREDIRAAGLILLSLGAPAPGLRLENA